MHIVEVQAYCLPMELASLFKITFGLVLLVSQSLTQQALHRDKSFILQKTLKNTALYLIIYGRGLRTQINTKGEALLQVLEQASMS